MSGPLPLAGRRVEVAVVGGGQAGLSASWYLGQRDISHLVIERHVAGYQWRAQRWDSFCLVTPNWQCRLPGYPYSGPDPDGFMDRQQIIDYLNGYIEAAQPPLIEGVSVDRVAPAEGGGFDVDTSAGSFWAHQVVVATGPYHVPIIPHMAAGLPHECLSLHSSQYRSPESLPPGEVLIVGSGQSGCQIAEDLHLAHRQVHLSVGSAPRVARRYRGQDVVAWLDQMGYYATTVENHPLGEEVRRNVNHYVTGRDGGHDLDLRAFARQGMELYGRLQSIDAGTVSFGADLADRLDHADSVMESIKDSIDAYISRAGLDAPPEARYVPVWLPPGGTRSIEIGESGITTVIWATGFRPDFSWIEVDDLYDGAGRPRHDWGVSPHSGLYFLGLPWLRTWGSARFSGIATDAEHVTDVLAERARAAKRLVPFA